MRVAVNEPWHRDLPSTVDALILRARGNFAQDLFRRADGDDAVPGDGYRGGGVEGQRAELAAP